MTRTYNIFGQVIECRASKILLDLGWFDNEPNWVRIPAGMPEWALQGEVFEAEMDRDIETAEELPHKLRNFRRSRYAHLSQEEIDERIDDLVRREEEGEKAAGLFLFSDKPGSTP